MYYVIRNRNLSTWIVTADGTIVQAGEAFKWAIGKKVCTATDWARKHHFAIYVGESDKNDIVKLET